MKKILYSFSLFLVCLISAVALSACGDPGMIKAVTTTEMTQPGQESYTISLTYGQEEDLVGKASDLLISADIDNFSFRIKKEGDDFITILLKHKETWYSVAQLFNKADPEKYPLDFKTYEKQLNTNYILETDQGATVSLKSIAGDKFERESGEGFEIKNVKEISEVFKFKTKTRAKS